MIRGITIILALCVIISCGSNERERPAESESIQTSDSLASAQPSDSLADARAVEQSSFVDLQGDAVSISEFRGKVVLIDFWETWCKPCLASFKTMQQLVDDYPDQFVVLAVTPGLADTKEDAREFIQNHDYDFVYLYDENKLHEKLDVVGIPFKVFVDAEGNFIEASMGSRGPKGDYEHAKDLIEKHS